MEDTEANAIKRVEAVYSAIVHAMNGPLEEVTK